MYHFFLFARQYICFCPSFAISKVVECSGAFKRSALSRDFELSLEFTSKFASRVFCLYLARSIALTQTKKRNRITKTKRETYKAKSAALRESRIWASVEFILRQCFGVVFYGGRIILCWLNQVVALISLCSVAKCGIEISSVVTF